jgi:hypothetical protein
MSEPFADVVNRVEAFQFDPEPRALTFPQRLARENRWSLEFAIRVIREYRRFCVLAVCSGHPVTPSEQVDQAWHLHLTYSRSYWNRFCPEVLRMELHHEPTAGGAAEGRKFQDWYARTLESYQRLFGERPPADIWPSPQQRFANAGDWCWVNRGRVWIIPRPTQALWSIDLVSIFIFVFSGGLGLFSDWNVNVRVLLTPIVIVGLVGIWLSDFLMELTNYVGFFYSLILFGIWLTDFLMRLTGLKPTPRPELISEDSIPERSSEDTIADLLARTNSRLEYFAVLMNETNHLAALSFVRQLQEGRIEAVADPEDASLLSLVAVPGRAPQGPSLDARGLWVDTERKNVRGVADDVCTTSRSSGSGNDTAGVGSSWSFSDNRFRGLLLRRNRFDRHRHAAEFVNQTEVSGPLADSGLLGSRLHVGPEPVQAVASRQKALWSRREPH